MFPFDAAAGRLIGAGQPVTSGAAGELDADVPDDGGKLVYRTLRGARQQVWERDVIGGRERLLVDADAWTRTRPRWSSDGHRLSYLRRRVLADGNAGEGAVAILAVDRRQESLLTRPGSGDLVPSDWSPDGKWLLGGCPRAETRTVGTCVVEVTGSQPGSEPIRVIVSDRNHNLFEQRFSPDQRWISFIAVNASDAGVSTIHTMPASGGPWQAVTDGSTYDDKPHWSPDGRILYFVSHRDGVLNVWGRRIDTATGTAIGPIFQVTSFNSPRQMISPQLSQMQIALTGTRLFLPITDTQSELWMLENVDR
jgi:Tol biopolymer transport system component